MSWCLCCTCDEHTIPDAAAFFCRCCGIELALDDRYCDACANTRNQYEQDGTVVVLGCGKDKRREWELCYTRLGRDADNPTGYLPFWSPRQFPLIELYTGNLYRARLAFARLLGGPHWIVSAFYGCKRPYTPAVPYERQLTDCCRDTREHFAAKCRDTLVRNTSVGDRIVVLASAPYCASWTDELRSAGRRVDLPLAGLGMGEQLAWLKKARELPASDVERRAPQCA